MRATTRVLCVLAGLTLVLAAAPAFGADGTTRDELPTAEELRFRDEFGLPPTPPAVPSEEGLARYGVHLSEAESDEIDRRFVDQDRLDALHAWALANAQVVGGVWLDQRATNGSGFEVVIQVTERARSLADLARDLVPEGIAVRIETVERSQAELDAAMEQLVAARPELGARGMDLMSVYVDTPNNTVVAEVDGGPVETVDGLAGVATRSASELTLITCNPSDRCSYLPYRGGLQLLDSDLAYACTSGFWAKSGSLIYMITASHCWRYSLNKNVYRYSSGTHLGTWINDSVPGPGMACGPAICYANVEAAYFSPDGPLIPSVKNLIYKSGTDKSFQITGYRSYANVAVGNAVCKAGITTNYTCGTVTAKGHAFIPGGTGPRYGYLDLDLASAIFTSATADEGDSGGPLFGAATAYGIATAKDGSSHLVASSISYGLSDLGLTLCTTSNC